MPEEAERSQLLRLEPLMLDGKPYLNIWSPLFHAREEGLSFGEQRKMLKIFLIFEESLKNNGLNGWTTWVEHKHPKVQKLIMRLGGRRYLVTSNLAWYRKDI